MLAAIISYNHDIQAHVLDLSCKPLAQKQEHSNSIHTDNVRMYCGRTNILGMLTSVNKFESSLF